MMKILIAACALLALPALAAETRPAQAKAKGATASAELKNAEGKKVGDVKLRETPNGIIATVKVTGIPKGEHAFHIHEVGKCEPPFASAGGHYNPAGHQHGIENPKGKHAGDLPNLHLDKDGPHEVTFFLDQVSFSGKHPLFDKDGSAFVIHATADDYSSDPAGNAGGRIACGVLTK
jgi:superoxide dismutase, Cu-Zn family